MTTTSLTSTSSGGTVTGTGIDTVSAVGVTVQSGGSLIVSKGGSASNVTVGNRAARWSLFMLQLFRI